MGRACGSPDRAERAAWAARHRRGRPGRGNRARLRAGDPTEIADFVSFLVGPASSYVNGSILFADGGELSTLSA
ncbi:SDR family oxidoreductase [Streptomyces sp. AcH 505]|uniref:SDR family oxidoreductase n=1 Tax=Streptomyces sp. AcH 505 TaxID=352211 RepID=UPI00099D59A6